VDWCGTLAATSRRMRHRVSNGHSYYLPDG